MSTARRPGARAAALPPLLVLLLALPACGGTDLARSFGFTRDAPDEFQVTTRAPLSMPPSLNDLPTPRPGASRPQELSQRQAAEATLVPGAVIGPGGRAPGAGRRTSGEAALVAQAGRGPVPEDVRRRVDEESLRLETTNRDLMDRLMFWREPDPPGVPVDAQREARRLRENAALGREPTAGETPVIQPQRSGNPVRRLIESIF